MSSIHVHVLDGIPGSIGLITKTEKDLDTFTFNFLHTETQRAGEGQDRKILTQWVSGMVIGARCGYLRNMLVEAQAAKMPLIVVGTPRSDMLVVRSGEENLAVLPLMINDVYRVGEGLNVAIVSGNLGNDAVLKTLDSGSSVANFSLAANLFALGQEITVWVKGSLWNERALGLASYLTKGKSMILSGRLKIVPTFTRQNGDAGASIELSVNDITFFGGTGNGGPAVVDESDPLADMLGNMGGVPSEVASDEAVDSVLSTELFGE